VSIIDDVLLTFFFPFLPTSTRFQSKDAKQWCFFMMKNRSLISTGFFVKLDDNVRFPRVFTLRWGDSKQYPKVSTCLRRARSASFAIIFRLILNF